MFLAFEVGNTRVACAVFDGEKAVVQWQLDTDPARMPNAYAEDVAMAMAGAGVRADDIDGAIVSSVVRGMEDVLARAVEGQWGIATAAADTGLDLGIEAAVPRPEAVGIDRLLAAGEAYRVCNGAVVTVGLGTAVTVDLVSKSGCFLGGAIAPGLRTAFRALHARASLLPEVDLAMPEKAVGRNTSECLRAGVVYGTAGAVDRLVAEQKKAPAGSTARVFLTGGDAAFLSPYLRTPHRVVPNLALRGLAWTYRRNFLKSAG